SGVALLRVARGVFRRHSAGGDYFMDSAQSARVGDVAGAGFIWKRNPSRGPNPTSPKFWKKWDTPVQSGAGPDISRFVNENDFPGALCEAHVRAAPLQLFWDVCLVGIVHVAAALFVSSGRTGRTRLRRFGNDDPDGCAQSLRHVSGVCQLRVGGGSCGAPESIPGLLPDRGCADPALRVGAFP